ncbi:ABC transporter ATP-binding protein [Nioella aestuarii]|uniref:ABC transporter ATP-binding protein n=1 Tax=Nioella aestuarii TaxID=1662864 RepID=UPI003D7F707D
MSLLSIDNLKTHFFTKSGVVKSVDGVSFELDRGEILGIVGESGSGKSVTGFSIMGLVDQPGRIVEGSIRFDGQDLVALPEPKMRDLRGRRIAMIFQDPMMTLNPVLRVDTQMIEALRAHGKWTDEDARQRCRDVLGQVGIPSPDERLKSYPHQFSGGMRQRVAIAIALLHQPDLIIADEPTTALDVTIQAQILYEVQKLVAEHNTAMIWVTHDLAVVAGLANRVAVMYAGRIVEMGTTEEVVNRPFHHYTSGLIGSAPSRNARGTRLTQIRGMAPLPMNLPAGCAFRPRCDRASEACATAPDATTPEGDHLVRCHHPLGVGEDRGTAA